MNQWFSTFLSSRHTNYEKKLAAHHSVKKRPKLWKYSYLCILSLTFKDLAAHQSVKKRPKLWKYSYLCILSLTFKDLAAHLKKFGGTLVRCGTPVEKHWLELCTLSTKKKIMKERSRNFCIILSLICVRCQLRTYIQMRQKHHYTIF